jgi:hypothetical protein
MKLSRLFVIYLACALTAASSAAAQDGGIPAEHHPWGRFPVGSWKFVRVTVENLDALGNVTGTTINETKTTLLAADATTFTLHVVVTVEASGKRFLRPPQITKYGYSGQLSGETLAAKKSGDVEMTINGRKIMCEVRQIQIQGDGAKYEGTVHYAPTIAPYVLRKEGAATGAAEGPKTTTMVEVLALGMPYRVLGDRRNVAFVRTIEKKQGSTSTTVEVQCDDIPGGEVAHSSQETNEDGKTLRRTSLELLEYHIANERSDEAWGGRRRIFHRNRPRRNDDSQTMPPRRP